MIEVKNGNGLLNLCFGRIRFCLLVQLFRSRCVSSIVQLLVLKHGILVIWSSYEFTLCTSAGNFIL